MARSHKYWWPGLDKFRKWQNHLLSCFWAKLKVSVQCLQWIDICIINNNYITIQYDFDYYIRILIGRAAVMGDTESTVNGKRNTPPIMWFGRMNNQRADTWWCGRRKGFIKQLLICYRQFAGSYHTHTHTHRHIRNYIVNICHHYGDLTIMFSMFHIISNKFARTK